MATIEWITSKEFLKRNEGVLGRTAFYEAIRQNTIPHVRINKKILVPADALERMLEGRIQEPVEA